MAEAASSTRTLKEASAELQTALSNLAEAESQFGAAAKAGSEQAAQALAMYRTEARAAEAAVASLGAAEVRETTALRGSISARMAASAEMRVLEMNTQGSTRAAAALIATIPGLAAFSQAIFPLFGVAALIGVGVQIGESLARAFDLGGERARELQRDMQSVNNELNRSITSLDVQIDKLQQEQAKLEKRPFNGMKLVLDEAAEAAQNLAEKLDGVFKEEAKVISGMAASTAQKIFFGGTGTKYEQTMLEEHTKWLNQAVNEQQQLNESVSFGNALQTRLAELKKLQMEAEERSNAAAAAGAYMARVNYDNEINAVQELMRRQQQEQTVIQKSIDLNKQQVATQHARDTHTTGGHNQDADRLRQIETQFAEMGTVLPEQAIVFWKQFNGAFKEGSSEYLHVLEQVKKYTDEFEKGLKPSTKISEGMKKISELQNLNPAEATKSMEEVHKWIVETEEDLTKTGERWREYADAQIKAVEISKENALALEKQHVGMELAEGSLTPLAAAQKRAAIDAEEYRLKLEALREELARLKKEAEYLSPGMPGFSKNQTQQAQVQSQILGVQGQANLSGAQDQQAITQQIAAPYIKAADLIESAFTKALTQIAMRQKSWQQAMAQAFVSLELDAAQAAEKWLEKWVASEIMALARHVLTNQQKVASDAAADAESTAATTTAATAGHAIVVTEAVADILSYAAVAAAAAAAAAAVGGPAAMAIAAGEAYTEVSSFAPLASFDIGTPFVPKTGVAMIHRGEQIVTESNNRELMDFVRSAPASRSSTSNVRATINNHYNQPGRTPSAREQAAAVRDLVRRGHSL